MRIDPLPAVSAKLCEHPEPRAQAARDVGWIRSYSRDIGRSWSEPPDFEFVDGDHWAQLRLFVVPGTRAFHDSAIYNGGHTDPSWGR